MILLYIIYTIIIIAKKREQKRIEFEYRELENATLKELGFKNWNVVDYYDDSVVVKSRKALDSYDIIKYFKEHREKLEYANEVLKHKNRISDILREYQKNNEYIDHTQADRLDKQINVVLNNSRCYRVKIDYITYAGNNLESKTLHISRRIINDLLTNPTLLMAKSEYVQFIKEKQRTELEDKHRRYYERVNLIIDFANENRGSLIIKSSQEQFDDLISKLYDKTVNAIKKIKSIESEEWEIIGEYISHIERQTKEIVDSNKKITDYYDSSEFLKIKRTCEVLMSSQREFNEYIRDKVRSITALFGCRVTRNETLHDDEYNYIRPYKKTITPFCAELSKNVFGSAENNPLEYVVKIFYQDKTLYPEQILKLYQLIEELETLREAKAIIEKNKVAYQQYIGDVPKFVMDNDEDGFFARLGFANIDESVLEIEYKFSYTSDGGKAQRSFSIPMNEDNIVELAKILQSRLTMKSFAKEQRIMMTKKLRDYIKERDNFTCQCCGNSIYKEPNLLLEIDHKIPVAKGGLTEESNLQTLCWKCNRSKSDRM